MDELVDAGLLGLSSCNDFETVQTLKFFVSQPSSGVDIQNSEYYPPLAPV